MQDASTDLKAMIAAAEAAGEGLLKRFGQLAALDVRTKAGPTDLVSIADEEAEHNVRSHLARARPAYSFLGEEGGAQGGEDTANVWVVDPLDGTTNFLFGVPLWAVTIAHVRDGTPVAGVTYLPVLNEMYVAEQGKGAWLNERRISVSKRPRLIESVLACGIPFADKPDHPLFVAEMSLLTPKVAGIRRTGAGAVDLAWVAAGRWDAYWERCIKAWDMGAGIVLVREAGGRATGADGLALDLHGGHVCVSNGAIHGDLIAQLNEARRMEPSI